MPIPRWEQDASSVVDRALNGAPLKLCVKTRDETDMLSSWIEHHAKIVGYENLLVADNGSTDPRTLELYERYRDRVNIFSFNGNHNEIHWHPRFAALFAVIKRTSHYFAFIDADERLIWSDATRWVADHTITDMVLRAEGIVPTTWLINTLNRYEQFTLLNTEGSGDFTRNLRWGKPIMPARLVGTGPGIHTIQTLPNPVSAALGTELFLLHFTQFPEQRIGVNLRKLASRKLIAGNETPEDVLAMKFAETDDSAPLRFQREIAAMLAILNGTKPREDGLGTVTLETGGGLRFSDDATRQKFEDYVARGPDTIAEMFAAPPASG